MSSGYTILAAAALVICTPLWLVFFFLLKKLSAAKRILSSYLLLAAVVYAAQLFTIPGIYLMFMGAALWVSLILNAMLLHMAMAAATGTIARSWLLLPGIVYGTWAAFAGVHEIYLAHKIHKLEALNHLDAAIPGDLDLLFDPAPGNSTQKDYLAIEFKKYAVGGRVFLGDYELQILQAEEKAALRCVERVNREIGERNYGTFRASPGYDTPGNCLVARHSPGSRSGLHLRRIADDATDRGKYDSAAYSIEVVSSDSTSNRIGYFGYGQTRTISSWPLFRLGCALNSGRAEWQCFLTPIPRFAHYGVIRQPRPLETGEVRAKALAELLDRPTREKSYRFTNLRTDGAPQQ